MPAAISQDAVFLNQMPDYQAAVAKIRTLKDGEIEKLVGELRLEREYQDYKEEADPRKASLGGISTIMTAIAGIAAGVLTYMGLGKKTEWKKMAKGASAVGAGFGTNRLVAWLLQSKKDPAEIVQAQNTFADAMATRMMEEQKALAGEGQQLRLVSTAADPVREAAEALPAPSKVAALEQSRQAAVGASRGL